MVKTIDAIKSIAGGNAPCSISSPLVGASFLNLKESKKCGTILTVIASRKMKSAPILPPAHAFGHWG